MNSQRGMPKSASRILSLGCTVTGCHDFPENLITFGVKSSCRVQPLQNHGCCVISYGEVVSLRCTMHISEFRYQRNIDRMDSWSSALFCLLIHPVSNQTYLHLRCNATSQNLTSLT